MRLAVFVLVALLRACLCETQVASVLELSGYVTGKHILPECSKSCQACVTHLSALDLALQALIADKSIFYRLSTAYALQLEIYSLTAKHTKQIECLNQVFYAFRTLFANSCTSKT